MTLKVIGAGVGRTGTYSLKLALNRLGFGPCFHMEEVARSMDVQLPLWNAALAGRPDWETIFDGYESAVDWPTARFFAELHQAYPEAKFVLGWREPETWARSFGETIYKLISEPEAAPAHMKPWLDMSTEVIRQTGMPLGAEEAALGAAFEAHVDAVKAAIPADRLLVWGPKEGWGPLCGFLGVEAPDEPFPRSNDRGEFWDLVRSVS